MSLEIEWPRLLDEARKVARNAHAPYSQFQVGAALLATDGSLYVGCNVENASYGLTVCAERSAVFAAVAAGHRSFRALLVATDTAAPVSPCGACRQVLVELGPDFPVRCYGKDGAPLQTTTHALLPHAFGKADLGRPSASRAQRDSG